jgi:hypothetical protein
MKLRNIIPFFLEADGLSPDLFKQHQQVIYTYCKEALKRMMMIIKVAIMKGFYSKFKIANDGSTKRRWED